MSDTRAMARWRSAILFGLAACSFNSTAVPGTPDADSTPRPDGTPADDGPPGGLDDIVNVRTPDEFLGTADLEVLTAATIDTTALTISTGVPTGVTFTAAPQDGIGGELAILHVRRFESAVDLSVVGALALVIIADDVSFSGALHADSAGVRGGFGSTSGSGAIEIYARTQLTVSGSIIVGSGGSQGAAPALLAQAEGGGDGGEIVLQAPVVSNTGRLTAIPGDSSGGGSASAGGDSPGRIVLLYRTRVDPGITSPLAETTTY